MNRLLLVTLAFVAVTLVACERYNRPVGARKEHVRIDPIEREGDKPLALVHAIAKPVGVSSVLPGSEDGHRELDGKALFLANCSACHQATGLGLPGVFPPLAKSPYVTSDNVERMAAIMIYGLQGPITVLGTQYTSVMAGLGSVLKDDELAAIATYARSAWGNNAGPVEVSVFEGVRKKYGTRGPFAISDLGEEK